MLNILTVFMFISVCVGVVLFAYIINNGNIHYMKYLATLIACVVIYIFGYMIEIHSNNINNALFWNGIQYIAIPVISTLWLIVVLLYIGIIKKADSWIVLSLFIIPAITYVLRWTNSFHFLYYTGYKFNIYGEFGILDLDKGVWYYVQQIYGCVETFLVIMIFLIYSYKVSTAERFRYRLLSMVSAAASISILMLLIDPKDLGLDYTAILFPVPLFIVSYLITKQDFFEISSTARNQIFNQSNEAMIILNDKNRIIDFNIKAIEFFRDNGIKLTNTDLNLLSDDNNALINALFSQKTEIYQDKIMGMDRYWEITSNMISAKNGKKHGLIKSIRDITAEYKEKKYLEKISKVDELTQLFNRREFNDYAKRLIKKADEDNMTLIMLMFDIDHFKRVNDTFGHQTGDMVLKTIAKEAKNSFRNDDLISRIGGEEFAVILSGVTEEKAIARAEEYRNKIADMCIIPDEPNYKITVSFGMAEYKQKMSLYELISNADKALYEAKELGRNKLIKYSDVKRY